VDFVYTLEVNELYIFPIEKQVFLAQKVSLIHGALLRAVNGT
jgi:hypothetical protein